MNHLLVCLSLFLGLTNQAMLVTANDTEDSSTSSSTCTLFMSPSMTTFSEVRLSMFAGIDMEPGTVIGRPEIAIPLLNLDDADLTDQPIFEAINSFMWNPQIVSSQYETSSPESNDQIVSIPGVGSLGNQHATRFYNADWDFNPLVDRTTTRSPQTNDAGRGSSSHYYDMTLVTTETIPAGMEILVGDLGSSSNRNDNLYSKDDFKFADSAMQKIQSFFDKHHQTLSKRKSKLRELYSFLVNDVINQEPKQKYDFNDDDDDDEDDDDDDDKRDYDSLIPNELEKLPDALKNGSFLSVYPEHKKSLAWLQKHAQCLDGIYSKTSSILPHQKGAFATRQVKKGDLIAPAPLILIPDKAYLDMKQDDNDNEDIINHMSKQLLINYSFGHENSSLLFYPYGINVNYINHNSKSPNAKLVWTKSTYHNKSLLEQSPDELREASRKDTNLIFELGMDIVAIRDIQPDEEIFLDYGHSWEEHWNTHIQNWTKETQGSSHTPKITALDLNSALVEDKDFYFHTIDEIKSLKERNEYNVPESVMTGCYMTLTKLPKTNHEGTDQSEYEWYEFDPDSVRNGHHMVPCEIISRDMNRANSSDSGRSSNNNDSNSYEYTVKVSRSDGKWKTFFAKFVPQKFIRYIDKPYTSDLHSKNSFRHYIAIPDEVFPETWLDLK